MFLLKFVSAILLFNVLVHSTDEAIITCQSGYGKIDYDPGLQLSAEQTTVSGGASFTNCINSTNGNAGTVVLTINQAQQRQLKCFDAFNFTVAATIYFAQTNRTNAIDLTLAGQAGGGGYITYTAQLQQSRLTLTYNFNYPQNIVILGCVNITSTGIREFAGPANLTQTASSR